MSKRESVKVALVGARGHTGAELIRILAGHPHLTLTYAGSRAAAGQAVAEQVPAFQGSLAFEAPDPSAVAGLDVDVVILAMPNGEAGAYVDALETEGFEGLILDLGADYRFDADWVYAIPELDRALLKGAKRIANPGCYATAAQLALAPLAGLFREAPRVFGVSGYSGAGATPSRKNNVEALKDNLIPYSLIAHGHEAEMARRAGRSVHFVPHVAQFFRGISATVDVTVAEPTTRETLQALFVALYKDEPFVRLLDTPAEIGGVVHTPCCDIGGITVSADGHRVVIVSALDNLLKGAASQAIQNINAALGLPETLGLI